MLSSKFLNFKNAFYALSFILLIILPWLSRDAGISGDEEFHLKQSEKVINYFNSFGKDKSALHTPGTHLKYYGQSFDNITTIFANWLNIEDIYQFRHVANAIAGWGTIFISGLLAVFLSGYRAGFLTLLLFLVSSRFLGHSWNNLKDIPFALGYIATIYFTFLVINKLPKHTIKILLLPVLGLAFAISIRVGGFILICYLFLFTGLYLISNYIRREKWVTRKNILIVFLIVLGISVSGYILGLVLWPFGLENPIINPWLSFSAMTQFPTTIRQIFEGSVYWSDQLPWYYLLKYMVISIPTVVLLGFLIFILHSKKLLKDHYWIFIFFLFITFLFPLIFIILGDSNVYGAWRHVIFIYPPLVILSALGYECIIRKIHSFKIRIILIFLFILLFFHPLRFIIKNHPYQYMYFNEWIGGINGAYGNYETDYYFHTIQEASLWLQNYIEQNNNSDQVKTKVALNFPGSWLFRHKQDKITTQFIKYYSRGNSDWDFAIIANSYIHPFQLKMKIWPPRKTIHTINVDGVPVCAILNRETKEDYHGYIALTEDNFDQAIFLLIRAVEKNPYNEAALINLSVAFMRKDDLSSAKKYLDKCLKIYPEYEVAVHHYAKIYHLEGNSIKAIDLFKKNINNNYKYFPSYLSLANIYFEIDRNELAVKTLKKCISINPVYKPAFLRLGNFYKKNGEYTLAEKYFNFAKKL